jgi:hypothetical protein
MARDGSTVEEILSLECLGKGHAIRALYGFLTVGLFRVIGYRSKETFSDMKKVSPVLKEEVRPEPRQASTNEEEKSERNIEIPISQLLEEDQSKTNETQSARPETLATVSRDLYDNLLREKLLLEKDIRLYKQTIAKYQEFLATLERRKEVLRSHILSGESHEGKECDRLLDFTVSFVNDLSLRLEAINPCAPVQ